MLVSELSRELKIPAITIRSRCKYMNLPKNITPDIKARIIKEFTDRPVKKTEPIPDSVYYDLYNEMIQKGFLYSDYISSFLRQNLDNCLTNFEKKGMLIYVEGKGSSRKKIYPFGLVK